MNRSLDQVRVWVGQMDQHWKRTSGDLHNDKEFWRDCIHSVTPSLWEDWEQVRQHIERTTGIPRKYSYITEDTAEILARIRRNELITKPYDRRGYNKPVFRAAVAIRDIMHEVDRAATPPRTRPTRKEILDQIDLLRQRVEDLFDE